jgi:Phosphatidylserine decarboxylase
VACGQRVGLIKFGSRVDVLFDRDATIQVKPGDRVKGGATVLALLPQKQTLAVPDYAFAAADAKLVAAKELK